MPLGDHSPVSSSRCHVGPQATAYRSHGLTNGVGAGPWYGWERSGELVCDPGQSACRSDRTGKSYGPHHPHPLRRHWLDTIPAPLHHLTRCPCDLDVRISVYSNADSIVAIIDPRVACGNRLATAISTLRSGTHPECRASISNRTHATWP